MRRGIDTRLRKLETIRGARDVQLFVVEGATAAERQAHIDDLIRSGQARDTDSFIHTGVTRSAGSPFRSGGRRSHGPGGGTGADTA
jgi:hypothetical protein